MKALINKNVSVESSVVYRWLMRSPQVKAEIRLLAYSLQLLLMRRQVYLRRKHQR